MRWWAPLAVVPSLLMISCGGDGQADGTEDTLDEEVVDVQPDTQDVPVEDVEEEEVVTADPCPAGYVPGHGPNYGFEVMDELRMFSLVLPDGEDTGYGPWPVVFAWHDHVSTATEIMGDTDIETLASDLDFPYIAVVPVQVDRSVPESLGWQILQVDDPDTNPDVVLFDCLLASIDDAYGVDPDRVYSLGFSTGAIMTNLLSLVRNDVIASTVSYSSSYYSDPAQEKCLGTECTFWPEVDAPHKFPTVVLEGGDMDYYLVLGVLELDFHADGLATLDYLSSLGHEVIYCPHDEGHAVPSNFTARQFARFFKDHPRSTSSSPYATAIPPIFPMACEYRPPM